MKLTLSKNAEEVLKKRILQRNSSGEVTETAEEMFDRVASFVAQADARYGASEQEVKNTKQEFYDLMASLDFLPNSPTLMNAGSKMGQLSGCYVIPVDDSMESIFEAMRETALVHKSGGGSGSDFSKLRPKGSIISTTKKGSTGPISFMKLFNNSTNTINEASARRGAIMGILRVDHPDILDFITVKDDPRELNNFNVSVAVTEKFMEAVKNDREYELIDPHTKNAVKTLRANDVYGLIVEMAWKNAEPGIVFIDEINNKNTTPGVGKIESTNVCGEQPLLPYESCNLGSINLSRMIMDDKGKVSIDFKKLGRVVRSAVRFLDNVIDVNNFPITKIDTATKANRKIGLGVMGFADMLMALGIPYNSEEGIATAQRVMKFISEEGRRMSEKIGEERGSFPNMEKSIWSEQGFPAMRNATVTTIAPSGTISIIAGCSSGIEPIFAISFTRKNILDLGDFSMTETHPLFSQVAKEKGFYDEFLFEKIAKKGSIKDFGEIPEEVKRIFVTSHDISPDWHVKMQAAFQDNIDNAVSKTVNMPHDATTLDVRRVFDLAYKLKCKGVTVYRDKSRDKQVLNIGSEGGSKESGDSQSIQSGKIAVKVIEQPMRPRKRPEVVTGKTYKMMSGCGRLFVTISEDEKGMVEVIARMGKSGGCEGSQVEAISRLVSTALRGGMDPKDLLKELRGIRCSKPLLTKDGAVLSCADAISRAIQKYLDDSGKLKI